MIAPRFSVLLPTHDRADVISFATSSVLAQSERDFELLIVGDGCTDDTASVVASVDDERIRWFDLPKAPGFGYANRNVALRQARGELVAFMAHDDLILPDHLATMAAAFMDEHVEWAYSRPLWIADDGTVVPFAVDLRRPDQLERFMAGHNVIAASSVVHRRTCLDVTATGPRTRGTRAAATSMSGGPSWGRRAVATWPTCRRGRPCTSVPTGAARMCSVRRPSSTGSGVPGPMPPGRPRCAWR